MADDPNVIAVYNQVQDWVDGKQELNASSIITLVTQLIPAVQRVVVGPKQGEYKKKITVTVLEMVINDSNLSEEAKVPLILLVHTTIPVMIDTMISIAHGKIDLAKTVASKCCVIS